MRRAIIIATLIIGYYIYVDYFITFDAKIAVAEKHNSVTVSLDDYYVEYDITNELNLDDYRVVHYAKSHKSMNNFGIAYDLAVLPANQYKKYKKIISSGSCGASYLNSHAENLLLIPSSKKTYQKLKNRNYGEGDIIYVSAKQLSFNYGEFKGQGFDKFEFRNAIPILYTN
jgi:hypothetical protein